jgi:hypothetical protein
MKKEKLDSAVEKVCLVSFFVILAAYKDNERWTQNKHNHSVFWNVSDLVAKCVLIVALLFSAAGVGIMAFRLVKLLMKKPTYRFMAKAVRDFMKEPYEPNPWMNVAFGFLGFMSFGIPIKILALAAFLGMFFSATVRVLVKKTYVQAWIGLHS